MSDPGCLAGSKISGMLVRNGGSFEDDLSLGAEANQLHQGGEQMEICNGMLAKDKRLQFHQKGRSMNSTGSGKSSATVSSVSELLELYEEDPEEVLYNLGFGRDEPDIASKIPSRFFSAASFARGIDIKVFLNAQLQRMEVENPNFALTSRFRQIEVLTTVANAFSSLYSQVSGTPLQKIGSMNSTASIKEAASPPPLNRSNTASRLMKTLSKLNLCGNQQAGEAGGCSTPSPVEKEKSENGQLEDADAKNEPKTPKHFKASSLATVKEEAPSNQPSTVDVLPASELPSGANVAQGKQEDHTSCEGEQNTDSLGHSDGPSERAAVTDSSGLASEVPGSATCGLEGDSELPASPPDKEACAPVVNPSIVSLMLQQKDSFEMEEIQSTEGEIPHMPSMCQLALAKTKKDQLLRSASQHSDSSGFAEDSSTDCFLLNQLQAHESLQAMGSSADSCDSETTVTSYSEELKTPIGEQPSYFSELDEEKFLLSEVERQMGEIASEANVGEGENIPECKAGQTETGEDTEFGQGRFLWKNEDVPAEQVAFEVLEEDSEESDLDKSSEYEFPQYTTHHILKSMSSIESTSSSPSSADRVSIALERAQKKLISSSDARAGRTLLKSKDLLFKHRHRMADLSYPLRRSQSLPTTLLNPVRVVSSVNVQLNPGKQILCSPPSFTYKYDTPEEEGRGGHEEVKSTEEAQDSPPPCKSTLFIAPSPVRKGTSLPGVSKVADEPCRNRIHSCPLHFPAHLSQSSCSLHSLHSDCLERPLCAHARTFSTHSIPSTPGSSCSGLPSPFGCPYSLRSLGHPHQPQPVHSPSTVEMQLRRVLHDIRSSLQNLSQNAVMRGHDVTTPSYNTQRSSILPLYENTFQDLQVVRRSLNLFRTQMMDLELNMLRQQTTVYQHMTEEERYEADQLQTLRKSVRMELQELEMQLEERLLTLEEQLRNLHVSSPYRSQTLMGMYGSRSADNLSCPSPLNVMEPVSELIREQSFLKSELGLGELGMETTVGESSESFDHGNSDSSSVCSSQASRKAGRRSSETTVKSKLQSKKVYRACVALMPTPPARPGAAQAPECSEEPIASKSEAGTKLDKGVLPPPVEEVHRSTENDELQQVIREIKESIVGEIRREIVSGLLAAVSSPNRGSTKPETQP
ncbi:PREDICTED: sperm-specific antigen 2 isoform X2 [Gekko japonicus]|uniref:Sperm-specific antigen 2 isoform X2 n=1 Tax=Gekko japonicus TaxID=146911 RepID=A0ABM1JJD6_GEKJA|nr:PREDICTED: sperm-specific antigen 2 isoform X2 [Gekko japonicus]